jgi:hypothetical protein
LQFLSNHPGVADNARIVSGGFHTAFFDRLLIHQKNNQP